MHLFEQLSQNFYSIFQKNVAEYFLFYLVCIDKVTLFLLFIEKNRILYLIL